MKDGWGLNGRWVGGLGGEHNWVEWLEGAKEIISRSKRLGMTGSRCEVCLWCGGMEVRSL
jgi:hypothetical protein